ncbi:MAG TPA: bifunctional phosphoglucose/phosphomannose isomerase [Candidatus Saccharimonadales bacterium]|nr:bifunctional phosphoglucose/phosphomannose isomerase [Candidatus Saccharimonadales bacterium]
MSPDRPVDLDALDLARLDPSGMCARVAGLGADAVRAHQAAAALDWAARPRPRAVAVCGMGGSAIAADLLRGYLADELEFPVEVVRDYRLPAWVGPECLVVASSYSGNTEETVAAYAEARRRGAPRAAVCSGGRLAELAREDGAPRAALPPGYPPRAALAWSFFTLLGAFVKWGFAGSREREVAAAVRQLERAAEELGPAVPEAANPAKRLARALHRRLPVVYAAACPLEPVALRWRQQLNENAKTLAHQLSLPEQNHNEVEGWAHPPELLRGCAVVLLRDRGEHPRVRARFDLAVPHAAAAGAAVHAVESRGETLLERLLGLVVTGDWVSVYLAFLNHVDPTPVARLEALKKRLEESGAA